MELIECTTFLGGKKRLPQDRLIFRPAVYALILNDSHILLVSNRRTGKYYLPGGGVKIGERMESALKREIREETGIEIDIAALVHFKEDFFYYDPLDEAFHSFLFFYRCTPRTFELSANDQIDDREVENPRWVEWQTLWAEDFQSHGEVILSALRTF